MKRIALLICLTTMTLASAFAIPARPGVMTRTQSDGSIVTFEVYGDEFNHYTLADGIYTVVEDEVGDFCFATIKDNALISSGVKFRSTSKLSTEEKSIASQSVGLRPIGHNPLFNREMHSPERTIANRIKQQASKVEPNEKTLQISNYGGDVVGERNLLVILVSYTDVNFSISNPREKFHDLLNKEGYSENGATGSTRDYFMDASSKKFTPNFDVVGPFTLPKERKYYGQNDNRGDDSRPAYQTVDACKLADESGVDFSKYDNDGDGKIDLVFIVYAGYNEAEGGPANSVWPHQWEVAPGENTDKNAQTEYDGKKLVTYACSSELMLNYGTMMSNIGTFCHEFGHAIGLPDWYDTSGGACFGLSYASIMNSGNYLNNSRTPPTYNIIERWLMGWAFPKEINDTGIYEISHISNNDAYIVWANEDKTECFLFESRVAAANYKWDKYLNAGDNDMRYQGGEGMLIYHLDWDRDVMSKWNKHEINTNASHECAKLFRAKPNADAKSSKGWFFPGSGNITSLSYETTPKFQNWDGNKLPFHLDNISISGSKVTFSVVVNELSIDVRQYDALVDWRAAKNTAEEWTIKCTNLGTDEVVYNKTTKNKYANIYPLRPNNKYKVEISGKGESTPTFEFEMSTQKNVLVPMSSLNMEDTYTSSDPIRLGVKNLDCTVDDIVWYVDGKVSEDSYITLPAGKHQVCAVVTDTEGNTQYLYRNINVN